MECPACSRKKGLKKVGEKEVYFGEIYECPKCNAIFGKCSLGESFWFVLPHMTDEAKEENLRYFDFTCLSSRGIIRRHGWYDIETKLIVQIG